MVVSAVIPAYNEEKNISLVLDVVTQVPDLKEVIVVSDGSTDNTAAIVKTYPVQLIALPENLGKGGAMIIGTKAAQGDYILFLDADLVGLKVEHIKCMLASIKDNYDMIVGIFDNGRKTTDLAQVIAPFLSGQRIVKKEHLFKISNLHISRFGVEVALTKYAAQNNLMVKEVLLRDLSHVMKEEKLGLVKGFAYRLKMYWEIAKNVTHG
ncbi:MAG: glycosyl transferase family 2 [Clostridiaceae bacterium BRH_c20a]|nr:MAG: glycosyl transferase family 2 [Clostridiaceae bacterium BRH_c20a]